MTKLEQVERLLSEMTPSERDSVLVFISYSSGDEPPGIEVTPGVCGGEARVLRTRIPVWVLEQARRLGATEKDLLEAYPTLKATDIAFAWAYATSHPDEIEDNIRQNEAA